jgi:hypothetical protein
MVEELEVPNQVATASVVRPDALTKVSGRLVKSAMRKGDLLLWSQLVERVEPKAGLSMDDIMEVVTSHHTELAACKSLSAREGDLRVEWSVATDGIAYDVKTRSKEFADDPAAKCLVERFAKFRFPKRASPTTGIDFPIRFAH